MNTTENTMFCFQCEQTAACGACTGRAGTCGKTAEAAALQDELTGSLIGLARAIEGNEGRVTEETGRLVEEALFATLTNVSFSDKSLLELIGRVINEKRRLVLQCEGCASECGRNDDYDMNALWGADEDARSLKSLLLFGIRGIAAYAYHARVLGYADRDIDDFLYEALFAIGMDDWGADELLPLVMKAGAVNLSCMELLDRANTESFGTPEPTEVSRSMAPGPFIIASGHDLHDLKLLLEQTLGTGVSVYTHGEMLPAHAYPELKKYPHLRGHFGTGWQNQQKELDGIPGAVLFTTNCLMPPKPSYADRVFTTGVVSFPHMQHVGEGSSGDKDFSAAIKRALSLGGYPERTEGAGANGGTSMTTGFGHDAILGVADKVVAAVESGDIRHFFLVGGCDGARPGRSYYADFVRQAPEDTVILTLACGKFRFNDMDLGTVGGIPRLLDLGQCNDAFGAIKVAVALAEAFECGVNDLPLSMVISWYEQKAVSILLTLLHLGIKGIYLGPTLPAFVSPNILNYLVENFDVRPTSSPEADMRNMLA